MYRNSSVHSLKKQKGGALAIAVFVIIVMTLLTVAINRNIASSTDQSIQEVLGVRALMIAESANEVALSAIFPVATGSAPVTGECPNALVAVANTNFSQMAGLENCTVVTACNPHPSTNPEYVRITSRGICKSALTGSGDTECTNADSVCASREAQVEAKTL